ncbi:hypothetical protein AM587_10000147 [Phytophthora nicotianae]|uniref:BZIP transcription factor 1 n=3 Tax=Phytophthora nicotianae TaxID=4792 RepID=A0A0W8CE67_PHYNI|nr:hypothetical protein AM587_10000147 [Phytophthora nicotianae]
MLSSILHSPNFQSLSQDTICNVRQRIRAKYDPARTREIDRPRKPFISEPHKKSESVRLTNSTALVIPEYPRKEFDDADQPFRKNIVKDTGRERHRKNQERYRIRQRKLVEDLGLATRMLRDEIQHLKSKRNNISIGNSTQITLQMVATEYFRVFRHGFVEPDGSRIAELDFLRFSMAPDLDAGTVFGFEALVRNWGVFSQFFQDVRVYLESVEQTTEHSLLARTTTSVTFTEITLRDAFLYQGHQECDQQERWVHIAGKLLGQRLDMHGSVQFTWDSSNHRVVGLISQADMITPLLKILGNVEDVSAVFSNARITAECNLVVGKYLLEYPLHC